MALDSAQKNFPFSIFNFQFPCKQVVKNHRKKYLCLQTRVHMKQTHRPMKNLPSALLCITITIIIFSCNTRPYNDDSNTNPDRIYGKVISIADGDSYKILVNNETIRVRMEGIDAPERGMPFYKVSKKHFSELAFNKYVTLEVTGTDRYGRTLAYTWLDDGTELSREMLRAGLAWHYKKYNTDPELARLEEEAKQARKGFWIDNNPMPPWLNRAYHRQGISTKDSFK